MSRLALLTKVKVIPVYVRRTADMRYDIHYQPLLICPPATTNTIHS
ncbi:MAG: hypothetical protein K8963_04255 [Proteobacteria bacterium]|nr:hypothetical protein [Pseudomonadota bacterium]